MLSSGSPWRMCPRYAPISETCLKHVPIITSFNNVRLSYTFSKTFTMREYMYMFVDNRPMKGMYLMPEQHLALRRWYEHMGLGDILDGPGRSTSK